MKKKVAIGVLILIPFVSILLVIMFRGVIMPNNEEIIDNLKNIDNYETDVMYISKNHKSEEVEKTKQFYNKDTGVKVEFEDGITKVYTKENISVKDNLSNIEYEISSDMDILHPLAFLNNILSMPVKTDSLKEAQEEWGDTLYIQFDVELFLDNSHLDNARVYVDKEEMIPIGVVVYNDQGEDTVRIIYNNFKKS